MTLPPTVGQLSVGSLTRSPAEKFGAGVMSSLDVAFAPAATVTVLTATEFVAYLPMIQPTRTPAAIRPTISVIITPSAVYFPSRRSRVATNSWVPRHGALKHGGLLYRDL